MKRLGKRGPIVSRERSDLGNKGPWSVGRGATREAKIRSELGAKWLVQSEAGWVGDELTHTIGNRANLGWSGSRNRKSKKSGVQALGSQGKLPSTTMKFGPPPPMTTPDHNSCPHDVSRGDSLRNLSLNYLSKDINGTYDERGRNFGSVIRRQVKIKQWADNFTTEYFYYFHFSSYSPV